MRRLISIIACTTAFTLVLAGCDINIEPADLSAVTIENDRAVIEKALGKPDEVVEAQGFTVAAYTYEKDYHVQVYDTSRSILLQNPLFIRNRALKVRPIGKLAAVYDADEKLLFAGSLYAGSLAGSLYEANTTSEKLTSIVILYKATQTGDADALFRLSEIAFIPEQQRTFLQTAAGKGSAEAQYRVSSLVTEDEEKISWLRKAAAQGHTQAQTELAKLSDFATTLARAERGEPDAQYALGNAYDQGEAVERDPGVALQWWQRAAESGHPMAQVTLAKHYRDGIGVTADKKVAEEWSRKAEEQDDPEALGQLADTYRFTISANRNTTKAISLYKRAAAAGSNGAMFQLGTMYEHGEGVQRAHVQAHMWYALAAAQGHDGAGKSSARIAQELSPSQVAKAKRLKREWLETHPQ